MFFSCAAYGHLGVLDWLAAWICVICVLRPPSRPVGRGRGPGDGCLMLVVGLGIVIVTVVLLKVCAPSV